MNSISFFAINMSLIKLRDICNNVLYSYRIRTCQYISYLTIPQCLLDMFFLSGP